MTMSPPSAKSPKPAKSAKPLRTRTALVLLATVTLTAGCGGADNKISAARSEVAGAAAAASSAEAAIAALSSKLGALTSVTPAPATSAPATSAPATSAPTTPAPTTAATAGAATASPGGLPVVPSGAALSSLLAVPSSSPPAPAPTGLAAAESQVNAALGGALSQVDVSKQCAAIPIAQVQALVKAPITGPANFPLQCGWKGTDLHVSLSPNDVGQKNYKDLLSTEGHPLPGLGDAAQWFQPVNGVVPNVNSRKGTLTCYVEGVGELPSSTMPYAGKDPFFSTKTSDAQAYANKEAKLCADIFAASKT